MKKVLSPILALLLALGVILSMAVPVTAHTAEEPFTTDLIAGGGNPKSAIDVGEVLVWNDGDYICVKYQLSEDALAEGWFLTETHLAIAADLADIPQKNGNPIPGKFPYGDDDLGVYDAEDNLIGGADSYQECISLVDLGFEADDNVFVAAHAVVCKIGEVVTETIASEDGSDYVLHIAEDELNPGYPIGYPGPYEGEPVPSVDTWVHGSWPTIAEAQWISSAYRVEDPTVNSWRLFTRSFDIPSNAADLDGTLQITSDNAEEVYLNDNLVGVDGEVYGPFVDNQEWNTVITYGVSPQPGANELEVMVRNYILSGGTIDSNPTGLIYRMDYEYTPFECETAWGAGFDFEGKNWATYFTYTVQGVDIEQVWPEGGTLSVAFEDLPISGGNDWDYNDWVADIDTLATFWGTTASHDYLTEMQFTIRPEAKIAGYTHVMHLAAGSFGCDGTYELYRDTILVESGAYVDAAGLDVVLVPNTGSPPGEVVLTISFDPGCTFSFPDWDENLYHGENLFFDPYIHVNNTGEDIHTGDVRMLTVPVDWQWPTPDGNAIWNVYPKVTAGNPPTFIPEWWTP